MPCFWRGFWINAKRFGQIFALMSALTMQLSSIALSDPINLKGDNRMLFETLEANDLAALERYLQSPENPPDAQNHANQTLLYVATMQQNFSAVDLLLNAGAAVDYPYGVGLSDQALADKLPQAIDPTPLLYAGAHGYADITARLLKAKPDLTIRNYYGGNALIPAAEKGHYDTAKVLLEQSEIDVDFVNHLGWTALLEVMILSDASDQVAMASLLLAHGADPHLRDPKGMSSYDYAMQSDNEALTELFLSHQAGQ